MKLTDPETIKGSEKDFIDTINAELDWDAIEKLLLEKHSFTLQDDVIYKNGDLVIHNNQIAYKFNFDIKVPLSIIFNREGECLDIESTRTEDDESHADVNQKEVSDPGEPGPENQLASEIADKIFEINEGGE